MSDDPKTIGVTAPENPSAQPSSALTQDELTRLTDDIVAALKTV